MDPVAQCTETVILREKRDRAKALYIVADPDAQPVFPRRIFRRLHLYVKDKIISSQRQCDFLIPPSVHCLKKIGFPFDLMMIHGCDIVAGLYAPG